jgi:hypothetical protein
VRRWVLGSRAEELLMGTSPEPTVRRASYTAEDSRLSGEPPLQLTQRSGEAEVSVGQMPFTFAPVSEK